MPPAIKDDVETKLKISKSIKALGVVPYCKNTHSPETLAKSKRTKEIANAKTYHNPETGEYKKIKFGLGETPPAGWYPGRTIRKEKTPKKHNPGNQASWVVYKNGSAVWSGKNMKKFAKENDLVGLTNKKQVVRKIQQITRYDLCKSGRYIVENGINTKTTQQQWSSEAGVSDGLTHSWCKRGWYEVSIYYRYTCLKMENNDER